MFRSSSCLVWLCVMIMIIIQISQAFNDDSSAIEEETRQPLERRSSQRVVQMLRQMLQRGEMQVHPHRLQAYLRRLYSRTSND